MESPTLWRPRQRGFLYLVGAGTVGLVGLVDWWTGPDLSLSLFHLMPTLALAWVDRKLEVFQMIGRGRSTRQIAETLHIGVKTVESYRARIKEKLNLEGANELTVCAVQWVNERQSS
jgi:DNA-binding CsgD family transcriptional regulator